MPQDKKQTSKTTDQILRIKELFQSPRRLLSGREILYSPCPVPRTKGIYAWYFRELPSIVPTGDCLIYEDLALLYVGIAPRCPPQNGRPPSRQRLYHRIRTHLKGNAKGSTLRLSLGCLLAEKLGLKLRRVGNGSRMTFAGGEHQLSEWLEDNAFVVWQECENPWEIESELFDELSLPLNLKGNNHHPFYPVLSELRRAAKESARSSSAV